MSAVDEYTSLHMVKVKGFASAEAVAGSLGVDPGDVDPLLSSAVDRGHVKKREGRLSGYTLTAAGRERHEELRRVAVDDGIAASLGEAYEAFLKPNHEFKQLTTDWQLRDEGADTAPLLAKLDQMQVKVCDIVNIAAGVEPRFGVYRTRFTSALDRLHQGDASAFARPMSDSYHDVWMELHEDLVASLGHTRTDADE
jgi:DNA-binding MarR family transcriptional regulator